MSEGHVVREPESHPLDGRDLAQAATLADWHPAPCPFCGAPASEVGIDGIETAKDGKTAIFTIFCSACRERTKAEIRKRDPEWVTAYREIVKAQLPERTSPHHG